MTRLLPFLLCLCLSAHGQALLQSGSVAAFSTVSSAPPSGSTLTNLLMAYWRLDTQSSSNYVDEIAGLTLTNYSGAVTDTGIITNAATFVSNSVWTNYLATAVHTNLSCTNHDWTFACWAWNDTGQEGSLRIIAGKDNASAGNNREWRLSLNNASILSSVIYTNNTAWSLSITPTNSSGAWHHCLLMWDSVNFKVIMAQDNAGWKTNTTGATDANILPGATTPLWIGAVQGTKQFWDGKIDEVGFWHRLLTRDEVTSLYNSGAGKTYPFQ